MKTVALVNTVRYVKIVLLFFLIISCENPLENRVDELENKLEQQEAQQNEQQVAIDSLMTIIQNQNDVVNTIIINNQKTIDSLTLVYTDLLDSFEYEQSILVDSLINEQQSYIDSMISNQQRTIEDILSNLVNTELVEEEVFNGLCPKEWTDIDVSNIVGKKKTLLIFRVDKISKDGTYLVFRPNGETGDWLSEDPNFIDGGTSSLSIVNVGIGTSGLVMIYSDDQGIIEMRANRSRDYPVPSMSISLKLEYYLN